MEKEVLMQYEKKRIELINYTRIEVGSINNSTEMMLQLVLSRNIDSLILSTIQQIF